MFYVVQFILTCHAPIYITHLYLMNSAHFSHSDKTNDEFRRFQGESQDGKDAEKMFRGFFRDTVETMLPGSSIRGPKLRDRSRVTLCKMFMVRVIHLKPA